MITYENARRIGIDACIEKLGRDFVMRYRDTSSSAYGDRGDHMYCFVGVSDQPDDMGNEGLVLTSDGHFPYVARCNVSYIDGQVNFLDCVLP